MEIRKVQVTGGSSYIVSLPKTWIRASNIQKNDPLGLIVQPDGSLTVTPRIAGRSAERVKVFDLRDIGDSVYLYRCLISAYVAGFTRIKLVSEGRMPPYAHRTVRKFIQVTIGQEVSDESGHEIIISDLLSPGEMPFEKMIERMYVIVRGMQEDAMIALKTRNQELAEDVISRDHDVNRLFWLVARQYNLILRDPLLARDMGTDVWLAQNFFQISQRIERVGNHVVKISKNVNDLLYVPLERRMIDTIEMMSRDSLAILGAAVGAFLKKDLEACNRAADAVSSFVIRCNKLDQDLFKLESPGAVFIGYIVESLRGIGGCGGLIAETAMTSLVDESP